MKKSSQPISLILATGIAGVALFSLANAPFTAALRGDVILGLGASLAVIGLAAYDYSRRVRPLALPVRLLRPTLPASARANARRLSDSCPDCLAA